MCFELVGVYFLFCPITANLSSFALFPFSAHVIFLHVIPAQLPTDPSSEST